MDDPGDAHQSARNGPGEPGIDEHMCDRVGPGVHAGTLVDVLDRGGALLLGQTEAAEIERLPRRYGGVTTDPFGHHPHAAPAETAVAVEDEGTRSHLHTIWATVRKMTK